MTPRVPCLVVYMLVYLNGTYILPTALTTRAMNFFYTFAFIYKTNDVLSIFTLNPIFRWILFNFEYYEPFT